LAFIVGVRNEVVGYTIGNDVSARDIEGENPLYLPQAKIYKGCRAIGPAITTP
jgi:2-dehydro-3-deoxy-D-arabinonate dehydratase